MDQSYSRWAIASISLALLLPVEFYANVHSLTKGLVFNLVLVMMIATTLGAIIVGHVARRQVRLSGFIRGGYGTASAGMNPGLPICRCFLLFSPHDEDVTLPTLIEFHRALHLAWLLPLEFPFTPKTRARTWPV
jgi:hypothetical protein